MEIAGSRIRHIAIAYFWSVVAWLSFSPVMAGQHDVLLSQRGIRIGFWHLLLLNGSWCLASALLTPPMFAIVRRYPITRRARFLRIAGYILGGVPFLVASGCARWLISPTWDTATQQFATHSLHSFVATFDLFGQQLWDYVVIVVAAHAYGYFMRARGQELERAELERELAATELQALKSQLHPHFLFNTLQGISSLIDSDRGKAKATVLSLSTLLRTALEHASSELISLDDELKFVQDYLEIEKMRLAERLDVRWLIRPGTRQVLVPQMILEPLVQNAIAHGIACCREGGWLEIATRKTKRSMELSIRNSIGGKGQPGLGIGLQNARARLKHLYGEEAKIAFEVNDERVARTILVVPALELHGFRNKKLAAGA
jgi:two-component system, LytTR family, sensor kinase